MTRLTIRNLGCVWVQVGDAGLLELGTLTRLTAMRAGHTRTHDQGLRVLRSLPSLKLLNLSGNRITDMGASLPHHTRFNARSKEDCHMFWQPTYMARCHRNCSLTGLRHLSALTRLSSLALDWCSALSNEGVEAHVAPLTRAALSHISLHHCYNLTQARLALQNGHARYDGLWCCGTCVVLAPKRDHVCAEQDIKAKLEYCTVHGASARRLPARWPP